MDTSKESLILHHNVAAVRMSDHASDDEPGGVVTIIPLGEIIEVDRGAPLVGRLQQVRWKGSPYGVFPEDLSDQEGASPSRHYDNPGIVRIGPNKN
jgi:hypothetical protein